MTDEEGGWNDLWSEPAPDPPPIRERIEWSEVSRALAGVETGAPDASEPDRLGQPETGAPGEQETSDGLTLFGDPAQFHVAWSHWNGMPEFHMDNLHPDSTLVVKFRTPEDREEFARVIGRTIRKEESRGIWYPKIEIAHFWDKRYRDANAETTDDTPILSEDEEVEDEDELDPEVMSTLASIEEGAPE
jgi:hypothetical protein